METFAYKYSKPGRWRFEMGKSTCLSGTALNGMEDEELVGECELDMHLSYDEDSTDDEDELPIGTRLESDRVLFCGSMTGVCLVINSFIKLSALLLKDAIKFSVEASEPRNKDAIDDNGSNNEIEGAQNSNRNSNGTSK